MRIGQQEGLNVLDKITFATKINFLMKKKILFFLKTIFQEEGGRKTWPANWCSLYLGQSRRRYSVHDCSNVDCSNFSFGLPSTHVHTHSLSLNAFWAEPGIFIWCKKENDTYLDKDREKNNFIKTQREEEEKDWGGNYNKTVPEDAKKTT